MSDIAVVYVAWDGGIIEAKKSVKSLKKFHPDVDTYIYSDKALIGEFDHVKPLTIRSSRPQTKVEGILESCKLIDQKGYLGLVYLDSDTLVVGDLSGLFSASYHYDIAAVHAPFHNNKGVSDVFRTLNSGVIAYGSTISINLIYDWSKQVIGRDADQYLFSDLIYKEYAGVVNLLTLPQEYNARTGWPFCVSSRVRIVHGRHQLGHVAKVVNKRPDKRRVWIPSKGVMYN